MARRRLPREAALAIAMLLLVVSVALLAACGTASVTGTPTPIATRIPIFPTAPTVTPVFTPVLTATPPNTPQSCFFGCQPPTPTPTPTPTFGPTPTLTPIPTSTPVPIDHSRSFTWADSTVYTVNALNTGSTTTFPTSITVTVPSGKTYNYAVTSTSMMSWHDTAYNWRSGPVHARRWSRWTNGMTSPGSLFSRSRPCTHRCLAC